MSTRSLLVVDDVAIIRAYVKAALKELPLHVTEASSGHQALELQAAKPSELILCDLNMPGGGGEAFLQDLRERGDATPVIMLTAEGDKEVVGRLIKLGIHGYVLKPFKPAILRQRVCEVLAATPHRPAQERDAGAASEEGVTETLPDAPDAPPDDA